MALHHGLHEIGDVGLTGDELKVDVASEARGFLLGSLISVSPFSPGFGDGFIFSLHAAPLGPFGPFCRLDHGLRSLSGRCPSVAVLEHSRPGLALLAGAAARRRDFPS